MATSDAEILETARKRFRLCYDAWQKQRDREKDDLRFQIPELQWDEEAKRQRGASIGENGVPIPARPMLSISRIDQPIQQVLNQERGAHLGVSIQPVSAEANTDTAKIYEGLYRSIERESQAHVARSWAFDRAVKCGLGAYRIRTVYDETTDDPYDQTILIERILHQEAVYFDPAATKPDFSDGNYAFIASWINREDFEVQYPDVEVPTSDGEFSVLFADTPSWVRQAGDAEQVLIVEYYYKEKTYETVRDPRAKYERKRERVELYWCKLAGWKILEKRECDGTLIPIVPEIGRELQPFDDERRWNGIIGPAKDAQRLYNYAASTAVEIAALEPKAPWIMAEGQDEGYEEMWQQSNYRNWPALKYRPVTIAGQPVAAPQRAQIDAGRLGVAMTLLQQADQFLQSTTATYDPSLGRLSAREKSGRAILALQEQGDQANSNFMHNLADISMNYEARVILELIPKVYDRSGRIARVLDEEEKSEEVLLNQPFTRDPNTKRPVPYQPPSGMMGRLRSMVGGGAPPAEVKTYDLTKGRYSVAVSIGKTKQTALQEGAEEIGAMLQAMPNLGPIILPLYLRYRDFPGAKEMGDLLAKVRDKQFPGLTDDKEGPPSPEAAQAKIMQLEQQLQMLGSQMQAAMKALETEQVKTQAGLAKAQMDNAAKVQIAQIEGQYKLALEGIKAELERLSLESKQQHDSVEKQADRQHEAVMAVAEPMLAVPEFRGSAEVPLEQEKEV